MAGPAVEDAYVYREYYRFVACEREGMGDMDKLKRCEFRGGEEHPQTTGGYRS